MILIRPKIPKYSWAVVQPLELAWTALSRHPQEKRAWDALTVFMLEAYSYTLADRRTEHWPSQILGFGQSVVGHLDVCHRNALSSTRLVGLHNEKLEVCIVPGAVPLEVFKQAEVSNDLEPLRVKLNELLPASIELTVDEANRTFTFSYWSRALASEDGHPPHTRTRAVGELEEAELCRWVVSFADMWLGLASGLVQAKGPELSV